ncbi:MAG: glycosyltransferase family 4 protein [Bacteroidaceae bacterium]|nr:glycosyltransferase family 4 protein [Bacteroidaceae bacterium]
MKILIVSKCPTHPTTAGNRRFILNQVELFRKMEHDVHFLYIEEKALSATNRTAPAALEELKRYWGEKLHVYCVSKMEKLWFNVLEKIIRPKFNHGYMKVDDKYPIGLTNYVKKLNESEHFECLIVNYYYLSKLLVSSNILLKAVNSHDYFCYKDQLVGIKNVYGCTDAHQESIAMQRSPHIFALNTEEAILFSKMAPLNKVYNVFSTYDYNPTSKVGNNDMLFLSGSNPYNISGLKWFVEQILPTIVKRNPDAKLRIGGAICKVISEYSDNPYIELVGFVDVPDAFYRSADVVINPTYQGTGLKIKTFESISYDKVTVVHPHSMTGIYKPDEAPIFSSTDANAWADYLNRVWTEAGFIEKIKEKNKVYLTEMQTFVESEYHRFFSCCK